MKKKEQWIFENERKYGTEIRETYGEETIDASYQKIRGMTEEQIQLAQRLSETILQTLKLAFEEGNPSGELAQKACELHQEWLCLFWQEGLYSKEAHLALVESYVFDERFTAFYDQVAKGCTKFFFEAMKVYTR